MKSDFNVNRMNYTTKQEIPHRPKYGKISLFVCLKWNNLENTFSDGTRRCYFRLRRNSIEGGIVFILVVSAHASKEVPCFSPVI